MAAYANTDGFSDSNYFKRSWALLTRDPGWIKPVIGLWLAGLIPFAGPLGVTGYIVEWARLTAWGISSAPKQRDVQIGACIASGWRAFLVSVVWGILWALAGMALAMMPFIGALLAQAMSILGVVFALIVRIAVLRSAVYQSVGGGMPYGSLFQMVENDAGGLLRILGITLVGGFVVGAIASIILGIAIVPPTMAFLSSGISLSDLDVTRAAYNREAVELILTWIVSLIPGIAISVFLISFFANILEMVVYTALGLWMRQFNVPSWGAPDSPLPTAAPAYAAYAPSPRYGSADQDPGRVPYAYGDTDYGQATHGNVGDTTRTQGPYRQP